ncbi:MAG: hypothetical protein ACR2NP_06305, partial [Pirellulaceae bacterium]
KVTNAGNVPLDNVTVINSFSRSLTPAQRSNVPQRWIGDDLAFDIGRLDVNQEKTIEVLYETNRADGDAFSRATVTTPLGASDQTGVSIRIDPVSGGSGGIVDPPSRNEPPVGIPADPVGGGLRISVTALDRAVAVNNNATFRVSIQNDRPLSDQNLVITLLVPPGTRLQAPDLSQTGLRIAEQRPDGQVRFEPRAEMRAGETLTFDIALQALQQGQATLAVQANSARSPNPVQSTGSVRVDP